MPIVPKDGVKTRAQAEAERPDQAVEEQPTAVAGGSEAGTASTSGLPDMTLLLAAIQQQLQQQAAEQREQLQQQAVLQREQLQQQAVQQEERARRQEEQLQQQAVQQREQLQQQAAEQRELAAQQVERTKRQEELLQQVLQQNSCFNEKLTAVATQQDQLASDMGLIKCDVRSVEKRVDDLDSDCLDIRKDLTKLEKEFVKIKVTGVRPNFSQDCHYQPQGPRVKVPPYDGSTSWSAYRKQFELAAKVSGWTDVQCLTALSTALRGPALSILDAMPNDYEYGNLMEAMEARYGERHLEHVFRAQLRDRVQKSNESLQQWALEVEKLVRKAYPSADASAVDNSIIQSFTDGIKDLEVRTAVRLAHHKSMKEALAQALEVEAVRKEPHSGRVREVVDVIEQAKAVGPRRLGPMCYACGERGHIRVNCKKHNSDRSNWRQRSSEVSQALPVEQQRQVDEPVRQAQGNE